MKTSKRVDADTLKQRLPEYLQTIGHPPMFRANGASLVALCPLHDDTTPSFIAKLDGDAWVWFCHPCNTGGTIIDLHAARIGRSAKAEFRIIGDEIGELLGIDPTTAPVPPMRMVSRAVKVKESKAISANELGRMTAEWRGRLYEDDQLREFFAHDLGLSPDTLKRLTMPAFDAMGIAPAGLRMQKADGTTCTLPKPRLVYIGDGGYKIRDPFGTNKPRFWRVGAMRRPWLGYTLLRPDLCISDVHLVESETSAAALIEAGLHEPQGHGTCVVAASGANGFEAAWKPLFAGRTVHFWPDDNPAGKRFFEETAAILHGTAKRILRHEFIPQLQNP